MARDLIAYEAGIYQVLDLPVRSPQKDHDGCSLASHPHFALEFLSAASS
jgi:hypothetical protein